VHLIKIRNNKPSGMDAAGKIKEEKNISVNTNITGLNNDTPRSRKLKTHPHNFQQTPQSSPQQALQYQQKCTLICCLQKL